MLSDYSCGEFQMQNYEEENIFWYLNASKCSQALSKAASGARSPRPFLHPGGGESKVWKRRNSSSVFFSWALDMCISQIQLRTLFIGNSPGKMNCSLLWTPVRLCFRLYLPHCVGFPLSMLPYKLFKDRGCFEKQYVLTKFIVLTLQGPNWRNELKIQSLKSH